VTTTFVTPGPVVVAVGWDAIGAVEVVDTPALPAVGGGAAWPLGPAEQAASPNAVTTMTATGALFTV
jgi:hypothetical protein